MNLVRTLRVLIVLEISLMIFWTVADLYFESDLPAPLREFLAEDRERPWSAVQIGVPVLFLIALVTAWVGLWRLRPWARTLYSATTVLGFLTTPIFGPYVTHGFAQALSEACTMVGGMTLALIWFSSLASQFRARPPGAEPL